MHACEVRFLCVASLTKQRMSPVRRVHPSCTYVGLLGKIVLLRTVFERCHMIGPFAQGHFHRTACHHFASTSRQDWHAEQSERHERKNSPWKDPCLSYHFEDTGFTRTLITNHHHLVEKDVSTSWSWEHRDCTYSRQVILDVIVGVVIVQFVQHIAVHVDQ